MKIRIIASKPRAGQDQITHLIGKVFDAQRDLDEPNRMRITEADGDKSTLNPGEYQIIKTKPSNEK